MKTAYGYVRVSSEDQADSGLGLEAQRQRIRAYCELKSLLLAEILRIQVYPGENHFPPDPRAPDF